MNLCCFRINTIISMFLDLVRTYDFSFYCWHLAQGEWGQNCNGVELNIKFVALWWDCICTMVYTLF